VLYFTLPEAWGFRQREEKRMALIKEESGCKIGWAFYDNEPEAQERGRLESERRDRRAAQGYDFGYSWPGTVEHKPAHPTYGECWMVVTT
jgi:hypothetical protein